MSRSGWIMLFACLLGVPIGVGAFTFVYAKGFSYLSNDPRACVNCHVMNDQYAAWLKSGHRHAPQELARVLSEAIDYARQGQLEAERAARKK